MFKYLIIIPVRLYQILLSPLLGKNCRFDPTCSNYMLQSVKEWGTFKGLWLGMKRISRCHPWGGCGEDPVPLNPKKKESR
ncbi:MAG TPA: membrane protein insertion efficiency factor YidD [Saprospiraceae bacterium]|jgi:putative membrane protein insertion efficiency factor|nr:membrane protein insertion efficiency factor YidD [Saprospiraceae bacterium]MBX7163024.1 membrane protein insertion efficiency factor YidD [Saprospiraceae bacterium]HMS28469.1 membrane protein insertion efficiency factor YidD [Saprospiraceae bacterium]